MCAALPQGSFSWLSGMGITGLRTLRLITSFSGGGMPMMGRVRDLVACVSIKCICLILFVCKNVGDVNRLDIGRLFGCLSLTQSFTDVLVFITRTLRPNQNSRRVLT